MNASNTFIRHMRLLISRPRETVERGFESGGMQERDGAPGLSDFIKGLRNGFVTPSLVAGVDSDDLRSRSNRTISLDKNGAHRS